MRANVLLMGMGGIAAYYPTQVEFHYPEPATCPPGRDMFGDVVREAHAAQDPRGRPVRLQQDAESRLSTRTRSGSSARANGEPVIYNGLYSTCINGGYYREQAMKILAEALDKYDVDGLFFNMFGNQSRDYSGRQVGLCHCDACKRKYREAYHKDIPGDAGRRLPASSCSRSSREVAAAIGDLIRQKRPQAGYFNYIQEYTDGIMSESNTAVARPLPLWPYSASDNVNRARNSQPGKMAVNLNMQFVDYWWRFATVPREEIALRAWQNLANGGALTFEVNGTLDLQDRQALETAKPIFRWAAANEQYYVGQTSAARVLLLGAPAGVGRTFSEEAYRGLFRLLSEEHIPFAVSDNMDWSGAKARVRPGDRRRLGAGGVAAVCRERRQGADRQRAPRRSSRSRRWCGPRAIVKGYVRVRDHAAFPSLKDADLLLLNGPFTERASRRAGVR